MPSDLQTANRKSVGQRSRERAQKIALARTTCANGHPWTAENIIFERSGWRRCRICKNRHSETNRQKYASKAAISRVLDGLNHGLSLNQMTASPTTSRGVWRPDGTPTERIMHASILWAFMRVNPAIGTRMKKQSHKNALANIKAAAMSRMTIAAPALLRNNGMDAYEAIQRATAHIWEGERGDVQSLMFIAIGEHRLSLRDCTRAAANKFLEQHKKRPRVYGDERQSLDAPLYEDSGMTRMDKVTTLLWQP
jgi:hypothetical protein